MVRVTALVNNAAVRRAMQRADAEVQKQLRDAVNRAAIRVQTTAKKNAPVDTGRLRASISFQAADDDMVASVGSNVRYAPPVEFGHRIKTKDGDRHVPPQPFLGPALMEETPRLSREVAEALRGGLRNG